MLFVSNLKTPACTSKQDRLVLVTIQYPLDRGNTKKSKTKIQNAECPKKQQTFLVKFFQKNPK